MPLGEQMPAGPKGPPQTANTAAIVQYGKPAIDARRQAASYDQTGQAQALRDTYQQIQSTGSGYSSHPGENSQYAQWLQQQGFGQSPTAVGYGATFPKSKYLGWNTETDMRNAVAGTADMRRQDQVHQADYLRQAMQDQLGQLDGQYQQSGVAPYAAKLMTQLNLGRTVQTGLPHASGQEQAQYSGQQYSGPNHDYATPISRASDLASTQGRQTDDFMGKLNDWYGRQSEPRVTAMETANQIKDTPLYNYERQAGAEMGIDPRLLAGWYPQSSQITDASNQRDIASLQQTGLPYSEAQSTLHDAAQTNAQAAAADAKAMPVEQQARMIDDINGATSVPGDALARDANATLADVHGIVTTNTYQEMASAVDNAKAAVANADPHNDQAIQDAVDQAIKEAQQTAVAKTGDQNTAVILGRILHTLYDQQGN